MKKISITLVSILISTIILSGCNENRPQTTKQNKELSTASNDKTLSLQITNFGLVAKDINKKEIFAIEDAMIEDAILIKNDKKMIVAHMENGLMLYDLYEDKKPKLRGIKDLSEEISSLSLSVLNDLLYVSDREFIVNVFYIDELILEMSYIKVLKEPVY